MDCWAEGGGKEGQGPKQKGKGKDKGKDKGKEKEKDSASTAQDKKEEKLKSEEAWMAMLGAEPEAPDTSFDTLYLTGTDNTEVDLYYSGATRHMSGFRKKFFNFTKIHPIPIMAADKRTFQATAKGDMYIHVPNQKDSSSCILLRDVLYGPMMGVTLVSISCITEAGSTVVFSGNYCQIYNKNKEIVGQIAVKGGLY